MKAAGIRYVMGTFLSVAVEGGSAGGIVEILCDQIQRLESLLSVYNPASEVSRINGAAGLNPVPVGADTYEVISKAVGYAKLTDGAFDPVVGGGHELVKLDGRDRSVFLVKDGMRLDLGGIGKGFALDRALRRAQAISPQKIFMDFGGQLLFWSSEDRFEPAQVAIEDPLRRGSVLATFDVSGNASVSTSSQAERPGHIVDPRTGFAARSLVSATVVAPTAAEAEAWSTALFVLGEQGRVLAEARPGVRAFLFGAARVLDRGRPRRFLNDVVSRR